MQGTHEARFDARAGWSYQPPGKEAGVERRTATEANNCRRGWTEDRHATGAKHSRKRLVLRIGLGTWD